jgi:hypothetical protein
MVERQTSEFAEDQTPVLLRFTPLPNQYIYWRCRLPKLPNYVLILYSIFAKNLPNCVICSERRSAKGATSFCLCVCCLLLLHCNLCWVYYPKRNRSDVEENILAHYVVVLSLRLTEDYVASHVCSKHTVGLQVPSVPVVCWTILTHT